ncbi:MAG: hypothetical protein A2V77_02970 [Anaeromyxobacter sp. RBG_16_69_14]|nr:MAG: hypothetical protein A2V77_02970 [Anaeromyxobacter sp. RBG_16_69_14]
MRKLVLTLAALTMALPAAAQERRTKIGIGIAIVPIETGNFANRTIELYLPIQIAPQLRLEPSLGIATSSGPDGGTDTRDLTLGVGLFFVQSVATPVDLYVGGRLKLNFARVEQGAPGARVSNSGADVALAGALGGEYYLVPKFSIGLEGQLGFYSNSSASGDNSGVFTTGLAFLRLYFM